VKLKKQYYTYFLFILSGATFYFLLSRLGFIMPLKQILPALCLDGCPPEKAFHTPTHEQTLLNYHRPLQELLANKQDTIKISVLVEKSKKRLTIFYDRQPIKSYPLVLGSNPTGDKLNEGDNKTPEGIFHLRDRYPHPDWSKFLWLDYPTSEAWREHFQAKLTGKLNWLLPIGGQVGIHGVPLGQDSLIDQNTDWTWGCISLKNRDIDEIYNFVTAGTLIEIIP